MHIEFESNEVKTKTIQGPRGSFQVREQSGYLHNGHKYPQSIKVRLGDNAKAYPPGTYSIDLDQSLFVDRFGGLKLGTLALIEE